MGGSKHPVFGEIPDGWSVKKLRDVSVPKNGIQTGPFGSQLHKSDYKLVGTPIITVEHIGDNRILHEGTPFVSDEDKKRLHRYSMRQGDIIFSRVGSVDRSALVRKEEEGWLFSGRCLRVRPDTQIIDPGFLSYFMSQKVFKEHIRRIAVGATMPSINTQILEEVEVLLPPLAEQRRIAHILGTLDDKIELNRRMNATLEAIARAIFKSWFVDFDPVRAKAAGRSSGLPPALDALFPSRFVDSELGEIPEGWEVHVLANIIEETHEKNNDDHNMVLSAVNRGALVKSDDYFKKRVHSKDLSRYKVVHPGEFAYNPARVNIGSIGVNGFERAGVVSPVYVVFRTAKHLQIFLDMFLKREQTKSAIVALSSGSVRQNLSFRDFASIITIVPSKQLISEFNKRYLKFEELIVLQVNNSKALTNIRDDLSAKLLVGELKS